MKFRASVSGCYAVCTLLFFGSIVSARAQSARTDSLKRLLSQKLPDTSRAMVLEQVSRALMYSEPVEAIKYAREGLSVAERAEYPYGIARNLNRLGAVYRSVGSYAKALESHLAGHRVAQENGDRDGMARIDINIGVFYFEQKDYNRAIGYYRSTKDLAQQIGDAELLEIALTNLSSVYAKLNQLDSAKAFALRAYEIAERQQDQTSTGILFAILGNIHYRNKEYALSLGYYRRSISLYRAVNDQRNLGQTYFEMGRVFLETNEPDSCRIYGEKALQLAQAVNNPNNILDASTLLTEFYEDKDKAKAYQYFKIATLAKEQMFDREKVQQIQNLDFNEQLRVQQVENEKVENRRSILTRSLIAGLLAVMLIAFLLYRNSRNRRKANVLLQRQKDELQATLTELKTTQAQLIQAEKMASLGELTAGISHEIQNPLNFVNNYAEVNMELLEELREEGRKRSDGSEIGRPGDPGRDERLIEELVRGLEENERKILHHGRVAEAIVRGMQQHSRRSSGSRELTDVNLLTKEYAELAYNGMTAKDKLSKDMLSFDLGTNFKKVTIIPGDIGRVVLNLLNNAFYAVLEKKETQPEDYLPAITVTTRQFPDTVEIRIKDNGTGIPPESLDKLFQPFFTTKPTGQGTGLGLSLAYDIITKGHSGRLEVTSQLGEWTELIVVLKI